MDKSYPSLHLANELISKISGRFRVKKCVKQSSPMGMNITLRKNKVIFNILDFSGPMNILPWA
jgi:hypothetical protein